MMLNTTDSHFRWVLALYVCVHDYVFCLHVDNMQNTCVNYEYAIKLSGHIEDKGKLNSELSLLWWKQEVKGHPEHYVIFCATQHKVYKIHI